MFFPKYPVIVVRMETMISPYIREAATKFILLDHVCGQLSLWTRFSYYKGIEVHPALW